MSASLSTRMEPASAMGAGERASGSAERDRFASISIVAIAIGLLGIGAVMTFSASTSVDRPAFTMPLWQSANFKQLVFVVAGLVSMLVVRRIPYGFWCAGRGMLSLFLLVAALAATGLALVPGVGVERFGARRWLEIPGTSLSFQPSEMIKIALPMFLAAWLTYRVNIRRFFRGLLPMVVLIGLCIGLIGKEDFGTAALLAAVAGGVLLVAGARWFHLIFMSIPAAGAFFYLLVSRPHRMERLKTFLDPWADPGDSGYQIIQSLCTIASGGWWGRGLGNGFAKGYLPMARSDFVFAVICEELGMIGAAAVIGLLIALMWQGRGVVVRCVDPAGRLLALGIVLTLGMQAAMNIAVVTASVPTKGIALPLVSAGGSGVIFLGALVGVLASIARSGGQKLEVRS